MLLTLIHSQSHNFVLDRRVFELHKVSLLTKMLQIQIVFYTSSNQIKVIFCPARAACFSVRYPSKHFPRGWLVGASKTDRIFRNKDNN